MNGIVDIAIIGSGPSGAQAAKAAVERGLTVALLDFGNDNPALNSVPNENFSVLRRSDPNQRSYFLPQTMDPEASRSDKLGAHFTAPRAFISRDVAEFLPVESESFFPVQSLALGGLGAGWGAGTPTFEPFELERAGLPVAQMLRCYDEVAQDIGVSGASADDTARQVLLTRFAQPPADVDSNAAAILARYNKIKGRLARKGLTLGRAPLALLTQPLERPGLKREANPYHDMDFYGQSAFSVYRPAYTIRELQTKENFRYIPGAFVERFSEDEDGVCVTYLDRTTNGRSELRAKKLLVAAGAINSARLVLRSRNMFGVQLPLLCNQMNYVVCINVAMFGCKAADRRHSLAQLLALYTPQHRAPEHVAAAIYSYRALLHYRLVRDMPLPPWLGLLASRAIMTSLTLVGVHHPERRSSTKWIRLDARDGGDVLTAEYRPGAEEQRLIAADLRGLSGCLFSLGCVPLAVIGTEPGSSIHYAGTIPISAKGEDSPLTSNDQGRLGGSRHVYLADSATWRYLPSKGLTFSLMANARRVALAAANELR
jgi:hypothetical protein